MKVSVSAGATRATDEFSRNRTIPITIPSNQEYYWRHAWQQGERESLVAHAAGESIVFDSDDPEDIVRWLHAPNENHAPTDDPGQN